MVSARADSGHWWPGTPSEHTGTSSELTFSAFWLMFVSAIPMSFRLLL